MAATTTLAVSSVDDLLFAATRHCNEPTTVPTFIRNQHTATTTANIIPTILCPTRESTHDEADARSALFHIDSAESPIPWS